MHVKDCWKAKKMTDHFKSLFQQLPGQAQDYRGRPDEAPVYEPSKANLGLYREVKFYTVGMA
jgi:hypothetical protein